MRRGLLIICELAEIRLTIPRKKASIKRNTSAKYAASRRRWMQRAACFVWIGMYKYNGDRS